MAQHLGNMENSDSWLVNQMYRYMVNHTTNQLNTILNTQVETQFISEDQEQCNVGQMLGKVTNDFRLIIFQCKINASFAEASFSVHMNCLCLFII